MNNSDFTLRQIKNALRYLLKNNRGVVYSVCAENSYSTNLVELDVDAEMYVTSIEQNDGLVTIFFKQEDNYEEDWWATTYKFATIQTIEDIILYN